MYLYLYSFFKSTKGGGGGVRRLHHRDYAVALYTVSWFCFPPDVITSLNTVLRRKRRRQNSRLMMISSMKLSFRLAWVFSYPGQTAWRYLTSKTHGYSNTVGLHHGYTLSVYTKDMYHVINRSNHTRKGQGVNVDIESSMLR